MWRKLLRISVHFFCRFLFYINFMKTWFNIISVTNYFIFTNRLFWSACFYTLTNYPGYQIMLCWPGPAIKFKNCKATAENSCICQRMQYRSWIGICFQFVLHKLCILQNLPKTYLISTRLPKRKKNISGRRTKQVAEMVKILKILYGR